MRTFLWHLNGCKAKHVRGRGYHIQDAFTRLGRRERALITLFGTRVEQV